MHGRTERNKEWLLETLAKSPHHPNWTQQKVDEQLTLLTKLKPIFLQSKPTLNFLLSLNPDWLLPNVIETLNSLSSEITTLEGLTKVPIQTAEDFFKLVEVWKEIVDMQSEAEESADKLKLNAYKLVTEKCPITLRPFVSGIAAEEDEPILQTQEIELAGLRNFRILSSKNDGIADFIFSTEGLNEAFKRNPRINPVTNDRLSLSDVVDIELTREKIDLKFANRLLLNLNLLRDKELFDDVVLKNQDLFLQSKFAGLIELKEKIITIFKKGVAEYKKQTFNISESGLQKKHFWTDEKRLTAVHALEGTLRKNPSFTQLNKALLDQQKTIGEKGQLRESVKVYEENVQEFKEHFNTILAQFIKDKDQNLKKLLLIPAFYEELTTEQKQTIQENFPGMLEEISQSRNQPTQTQEIPRGLAGKKEIEESGPTLSVDARLEALIVEDEVFKSGKVLAGAQYFDYDNFLLQLSTLSDAEAKEKLIKDAFDSDNISTKTYLALLTLTLPKTNGIPISEFDNVIESYQKHQNKGLFRWIAGPSKEISALMELKKASNDGYIYPFQVEALRKIYFPKPSNDNEISHSEETFNALEAKFAALKGGPKP